MAKVIVGMSGGVDSSVTVHLLKEQGYEVEGVSFILYEARLKNTFPGCCSIESINDAAKTAGHLGVSHTSIDLRDEFMEKVIEPFIDAYSKGITPNPCILCNKYIKFPHLLKIADKKNAEFVATGHYARVQEKSDSRRAFLKKGIDEKKDQSYVLYVLRPEDLGRLKLPLGGTIKKEVREIAGKLGLPAAARPESQEICFIEDRNYCGFLQGLTEAKEGPIVDVLTGKILGRHKGIHLYTTGQRKRLGIATGEPLYVVKIDPSENTIFVGPKDSAMMKEFVAGGINWLVPGFAGAFDGAQIEGHQGLGITVKVRSTMKAVPARIHLIDNDMALIVFDLPQWAPAPGQSAVFYDGDIVLGGGVIVAGTG